MSAGDPDIRFDRDTMLEATMSRDAGYDGKFYVGVTTTGIYCLPSCKAKKPLARNIVFFTDRAEAIAAGFRGCKRCRSESYPDVAPDWLKDVLELMRERPAGRIDETEVADQAGVDISTVRRHFKTKFGTTPLAFHRRARLARAKGLLEAGADYLTAAYECGFESASGFREAFFKEFGVTPGSVSRTPGVGDKA
jgi:AraC family transcriptional regulator of adaptative response/methylated-DNA-[protein]-cysteine methyltransferase